MTNASTTPDIYSTDLQRIYHHNIERVPSDKLSQRSSHGPGNTLALFRIVRDFPSLLCTATLYHVSLKTI